MVRWNKRQNKVCNDINLEVKKSLDMEKKSDSYEDRITECYFRIDKYNDMLNINPHEYTSSLLFTFILLLLAMLSHLFFASDVIFTFGEYDLLGHYLTFTLFWIGIYYLIKHFILILFIVEQT